MKEKFEQLLHMVERKRATDVHFTLMQHRLHVQVRGWNGLETVQNAAFDEGLFCYLKYISNLDLGNTLQPQSGNFQYEFRQELLYFRFSLLPTLEKQTAVLRVLNNHKEISLEDLSLDSKQTASFLNWTKTRSGLIVLSGPTGSGKTTTTAKLTKLFQSEDSSVVLAAADTFRAGAIDQLAKWADRLGVTCIKGREGGDPSAALVDACRYAKEHGMDYLIGDTAGRLQNKANLMQELSKMRRVIEREIPGAPHEVWLVLDATTGQNGISQAQIFLETTKVSGIILTKMDGTAKGGIVIAIRDLLGLPVKYIGLGEKEDDLRPFDIDSYLYGLCEDILQHD